ncbi:MAG: hypothetical protein JW867_04120 [Candidatus Omnitrophica bacterium]|nr:hypothetical protein [Candidatus Omnitrophota bacterium]
MKVQIVCYEDIHQWILGKIGLRLTDELRNLSVKAKIGYSPDARADINHYIICFNYNGEKNTLVTFMITHVETAEKVADLKERLVPADMGICMSAQTQNQLIARGIKASKLCYINPAHDGLISPRPLVVGITGRIYEDGRKNENILVELCQKIEPDQFSFTIMGSGWENIVKIIRSLGFAVQYYNHFDYHRYLKIIPSLDYYLYWSYDEGSMGFIDALSAGVETIVTPQGYHLDVKGGISYPIQNISDMVDIFKSIADKRRERINSVSQWTWPNYAQKHIDIWTYLLNGRDPAYLAKHKSNFPDGLSSLKSP